MDEGGILSNYTGVSIHDGLPSYRKYDQCDHALCNEHHHRELVAVVENDLQPWVKQMIDLLYDIKRKKEERISVGFARLNRTKSPGTERSIRPSLTSDSQKNHRHRRPWKKRRDYKSLTESSRSGMIG